MTDTTAASKVADLLPEETTIVLVAGANYWGRAEFANLPARELLAIAKENLRKEGGTLPHGYEVYAFGADTETAWVDQMGYTNWRYTDEAHPSQPLGHWVVKGNRPR